MNNTYGITIESFLYDISLESIAVEYAALEAETGTVLNADGTEAKSDFSSRVPKFLQKIGGLFRKLGEIIRNFLIRIRNFLKDHRDKFVKEHAKYNAPSEWVNAFNQMCNALKVADEEIGMASAFTVDEMIKGLREIKINPRSQNMYGFIATSKVQRKEDFDAAYTKFRVYDILLNLSESDINEKIQNYNGPKMEFDWKKGLEIVQEIEKSVDYHYKTINKIISSGVLDHINAEVKDLDEKTAQDITKIVRAVFNWEMSSVSLLQKEVNRLYFYINLLSNKKFKV